MILRGYTSEVLDMGRRHTPALTLIGSALGAALGFCVCLIPAMLLGAARLAVFCAGVPLKELDEIARVKGDRSTRDRKDGDA